MRSKSSNLVNALIVLFLLCGSIYSADLEDEELEETEVDTDSASVEENDSDKNETRILVVKSNGNDTTGSKEIERILNGTEKSSKDQLPINSVEPTVILPEVIPLPIMSAIGEILVENEKSLSNKTSMEDITAVGVTTRSPDIQKSIVEDTAPLVNSSEPSVQISESNISDIGALSQTTSVDTEIPPIKDILESHEITSNSIEEGETSDQGTRSPQNARALSVKNLEVAKASSALEKAVKNSDQAKNSETLKKSVENAVPTQNTESSISQTSSNNNIEDIKQANSELLNIPEDLMALLREQNREEVLKLALLNSTDVTKLPKEELENRRKNLETPLPDSKKHRLRLEDECRPKLDLVFLLDTSGSIEQIYKEHVKWAVALVDSLPLEPDAVRVAAVQYAGFPLTEFALGTYPSAEDIRAHLERIKFQSGVTRTGYALRKAELELFREDRGAREDAVKVIIIFTDGLSVDDPSKPAQQLRDIKGVKIYVVNIGTDNFESEMMKIAGKQENIFGPNDLQRLREAVLNDAERARGCSRVGPKIFGLPQAGKFVSEGTPEPILHPLSAFEISEKLEKFSTELALETTSLDPNTKSLIESATTTPLPPEIQTMIEAQEMLEAMKKDQETETKLKVEVPLQENTQKSQEANSETKKIVEITKKVNKSNENSEILGAQNSGQPKLMVKISTPDENFSKDTKSENLPKEEPLKPKKKARPQKLQTTAKHEPRPEPEPKPEPTAKPKGTSETKPSKTTRKRRIRTTTTPSTTTLSTQSFSTKRPKLLRQKTSPRQETAEQSTPRPKTISTTNQRISLSSSPKQEASKNVIFDSIARPLILENPTIIPRANEVQVISNNFRIKDDENESSKVKQPKTTTTARPTTSRSRPTKANSSKLMAIENSNRDAFEMSSADRAKFEATSKATTERLLTTSKFLRKRIRTTTVSDLGLQKVDENLTTRKSFGRNLNTRSTTTPLPTTTTRRRFTSTRPARKRLFAANIQFSEKRICPMDLLFIVDSSGSVQTFYDKQKEFLNDLLGVIELGEHAHRVAMLQFAGNKMHKTEWPYDAYNNTNDLLKAFNQIRHITGTTYIGSALNSAVRVLERRRREVPNIVLLLSDGFSQDDASFPATEIRRLASNQFYAVSITELSNKDYLANLVGDPKRVYVGSEADDLKSTIINKLQCRA